MCQIISREYKSIEICNDEYVFRVLEATKEHFGTILNNARRFRHEIPDIVNAELSGRACCTAG